MLNKALQEALSTKLTLGEEDENDTPGNQGASSWKVRIGQGQTFMSNTNTNTSTSMMNDDGLNFSVESDVDMSLAYST